MLKWRDYHGIIAQRNNPPPYKSHNAKRDSFVLVSDVIILQANLMGWNSYHTSCWPENLVPPNCSGNTCPWRHILDSPSVTIVPVHMEAFSSIYMLFHFCRISWLKTYDIQFILSHNTVLRQLNFIHKVHYDLDCLRPTGLNMGVRRKQMQGGG